MLYRDLQPCNMCHGDPIVTSKGETFTGTILGEHGRIYLDPSLASYRHGNQYFNESLSSLLPLDIDRGDVRNYECTKQQYPFLLPTTVSILIRRNKCGS